MLSLVMALRTPEGAEPERQSEAISIEKPSLKETLLLFGALLAVAVIGMSLLMFLAWVVFLFTRAGLDDGFLAAYLKGLTAIAVFCLLFTAYLYARESIRFYRLQHVSRPKR